MSEGVDEMIVSARARAPNGFCPLCGTASSRAHNPDPNGFRPAKSLMTSKFSSSYQTLWLIAFVFSSFPLL